MEIREPRKSDAKEIEELARKSWIEGFKPVLTEKELEKSRDPEYMWTEDQIKEKMNDENSINLVAEVDEKVVGKIKAFWKDEDTQEFVNEGEAELRGLYVHPDFWRQGIATNLVEEVIEQLPDGISALKVETFKDVDKTTSFYQKNGFEKFSKRKVGNNHIGTLEEKKDTVLMKKEL